MAYLCAMHLKEGFVLRELGDEHIVIGEGLTVDFQRLVSLNSSAAFLWRGVEGREFGVDDLTALLLDEYEVEPDEAASAARDIAREWLKAGLVEEEIPKTRPAPLFLRQLALSLPLEWCLHFIVFVPSLLDRPGGEAVFPN